MTDRQVKTQKFITEWGRYMYLRMPQEFLAAGGAYTHRHKRYKVIKDIPRKVKCVDDTLLYHSSIKESFFHTWDFLTLCAEKGIVINADKFQFSRDIVTFVGLTIIPTGITPSNNLLSAIKDCPTPKDITRARSWFRLVNQVSWAYSISSIMQPFRDLIKPNSKFHWDETLDKLFQDSKALLITAVEEGIRSFDINQHTCLQTNWSQEGIGYLLLQNHFDCPMPNAPVCCPTGWHLVYAGSRFTMPAECRYAPTEGEALAVA